MKMTNNEYGEFVSARAPKSRVFPNIVKAFLIGGLICCIGQALGQLFSNFGLSKEDTSTAVSVTLVFLGALFTGVGLYDKLAKAAGAGSLVPITGFANAVVAPALEFRSEGLVMGMSSKMFVVAGPVLVFGLAFSVVYGFILALIS